MKRILLLLAACGGGSHTPDVCDRWMARDPGANRKLCDSLLDAGAADPASPGAPAVASLDCSIASSDDRSYARCRADAVAALAAVTPVLDAPARVRAAMDKDANAADLACGDIADALAGPVPKLPSGFATHPSITALVDADGTLCKRDLMIHESRTKTCIDAAMTLADIRGEYRDADTKQAWVDLIARCPDQKGIITEAEDGASR